MVSMERYDGKAARTPGGIFFGWKDIIAPDRPGCNGSDHPSEACTLRCR